MTSGDLAKLGSEPIPGANPVGEDIQFDEDFGVLRLEIAKLESVTGEAVAWSQIIEKSTKILAEKSKHLQVAIYLTLALFEKDGYPGLLSGLNVFHDLLVNFWETMYPPVKRKRGRIEPVLWLAERGGAAAAARPAATGDLESLKAIAEVMGKIETLLSEKLGPEAPGLGDLRRDLTNKARDIEGKAKAAEVKATAKATAAAAGAPLIDSFDDANRTLGVLRQNARNIADFFRKADPTNAFPYRLMRAVYFSSITALPPHKDGVTQIPAVPAEAITRLDEMLSKKEYGAVIEEAEGRFAGALFWLDAHRYTLSAMEGAGEKFDAAREAIAGELSSLVKRYPEMLELKFANGTPLASGPTVGLLQQMVAAAGKPGKSHAGPTSEAQDDRLAETYAEARRLAGKGKLPDALGLFQGGIAQIGSRREQFLWRLAMARLCLDVGQMQVAVPQLEFLGSQIDEHRLEEWEPGLCRDVFGVLYAALVKLSKVPGRAPDPEFNERLRHMHGRLCRLDPAAALAIEGKK